MTVTRRPIFMALVLIVISLTSCSEIKTSDAKETFKYWAGTNPPADIELLNGQYWQSSHWSKEYIMYLKLKPSKTWWDDFVKQNSLTVDTTKWSKPDDAPNWFEPTKNTKQYGQAGFAQVGN